MRKKRLIRLIAPMGCLGVVGSLILTQPQVAGSLRVVQPETRDRAQRTDIRAALADREGLGAQRGELFGSLAFSTRAPVARGAAPAAPTAPPMPYRVAGHVVHDGKVEVVLARDDRVLMVREGETLDGGYRVEAIRSDGVTLVYTPLQLPQHLAAASVLSLAPSRAGARQPAVTEGPARLRWEGPERVQAGSNFDVSLKLTSAQALRSSPLELSFDAALLEPVGVRPGGFFADGNFSYRVSRNGAIFVGASGTESAADDAELLVLTFKPIRAGATAELKVSSLVLESAAGPSIAHEQPTAFRTAIVQ